jgi:hypothetical protein
VSDGAEGALTADEVYALTGYLLFLDKVVPEDQVVDIRRGIRQEIAAAPPGLPATFSPAGRAA